MLLRAFVVPHAGTWIEIATPAQYALIEEVLPHAGTWIEISINF